LLKRKGPAAKCDVSRVWPFRHRRTILRPTRYCGRGKSVGHLARSLRVIARRSGLPPLPFASSFLLSPATDAAHASTVHLRKPRKDHRFRWCLRCERTSRFPVISDAATPRHRYDQLCRGRSSRSTPFRDVEIFGAIWSRTRPQARASSSIRYSVQRYLPTLVNGPLDYADCLRAEIGARRFRPAN